MKVSVATMERGESRALPQTPCPEVQPPPSVTPTPTRRPPNASAAVGTGTSMTGQPPETSRQRSGALTIPATALDKAGSDGRYRVRVLDADQRIVSREVRIGMNNKIDAQVLDGLREGEQVVIGEASASAATPATSPRRGPPPMM